MFITTSYRRNKNSKKKYGYQQLCQCIRTEKGPRKKLILTLGKVPLPKEKWPLLAKRISDYIKGQEELFPCDKEVDQLAVKYAEEILRKYENDPESKLSNKYEKVDIDTIKSRRTRTIGVENIGLKMIKELKFEECLKECGFSDREIEVAILLVISRLCGRVSELSTYLWSKYVSGLEELMGTDFRHLSLNTLYKVTDKLIKNKEAIERHLREREREIFGLDEKIILYDLTNTYLEGLGIRNKKAKFGHSKENRKNNRLLSLGLVLDDRGFPKMSRIYEGNISEPKTLLKVVKDLEARMGGRKSGDRPTVIIDAGIATEKNLMELKKEYHYICVSRKRVDIPDDLEYVSISSSGGNEIKAKLYKSEDEVYLYCESSGRVIKEEGIRSRLEQLFEEELKNISISLKKRYGTKRIDKVWERIGRIKEKYSRISRYYDIKVEELDGKAVKISWEYNRDKAIKERFSGSYYIKTDRTDLTEQKIWEIYMMLNEMESAFRIMKSFLGIRPIHHHKEARSDAHIFLTILAYHVFHSIRTRLKENNISYNLDTLRLLLQSHNISTITIRSEDGSLICVRKCSEPEHHQLEIYDALGVEKYPVKRKKYKIKNL